MDWDEWLKAKRKPGVLSRFQSWLSGDTSSNKDVAGAESSNDEEKATFDTLFDTMTEKDLCIFHTLLEAAAFTDDKRKQDQIRHLRDVRDKLESIAAHKRFVLVTIPTAGESAIQWARSYVKVGTLILHIEPKEFVRGLHILDSSISIRRQLEEEINRS